MSATRSLPTRRRGAFAELMGRVLRLDGGAMAVISLVLLASAATVSGAEIVSAGLVAVGLAFGVIPVWQRRQDTVVRLGVFIAGAWLCYAALVGSLPTPTNMAQVRSWATTEGRALVVLAAMCIARGVRRTDDVRWLCRALVVVVTAGHSFALLAGVTGVDVPGLTISDANGLFFGLSSSHHVVGFLSAVVIVVVVGVPSCFSPTQQWAAVVIALASIGASGSRTSLLGVGVAVAWIAVHRYTRQRVALAVVTIVVVAATVIVANDRFRTTVDVVTRPEFLSEATDAWSSGTQVGIRNMSDSAVEANILLRFAAWGIAWQSFADSPTIGIGVFRQNDIDLTFSGRRGVVLVATGGTRVFNDAEPHNVVLFLLQESGVLGLALFASPYVYAWRRSGRSRFDDSDDVDHRDHDQLPVEAADATSGSVPTASQRVEGDFSVMVRASILNAIAISLVSSGLLATGLGLAANAVIFSACGCGLRPPSAPDAEREVLA